MWKHIKLFLILCLISTSGFATHIVGGDIHYEHLGGNNYRITLKIYRDCATSSTDFDDPTPIGVYDNAGNLIVNLEIPYNEAIISDVPVDTYNECLDPPSGICVKEAIFETEVELPPVEGGYLLVYQRCCRNTTLINTVSNDDIGITLYAEIPGPEVTSDNSNPYFNEYPPIVICMNEPFSFDHSATDPDGDSLVYQFCTPLLSNVAGFYINPPGPPPYPELTFLPDWNTEYPITSDPAFAIDPQTGEITGTPTQLGQFVFGVCVEEYRDGELISTTNRDFQFNVVFCDPGVVAAIPDQTSFCEGLEVSFENNSINADEFFWDFGVEGVESDTSNLGEPVFTFPDYGEYEITLIAMPGLSCADTSQILYEAQPLIAPNITNAILECDEELFTYTFEVETEASSDAEFFWNFGLNGLPGTANTLDPGPIQFDPGPYTVNVTLSINEYGCETQGEYELQVPGEIIASFPVQSQFCNGLEFSFENNTEFADEFLWDFGFASDASDESTDFEPTITFPEEGIYTVSLFATAEDNCPSETEAQFSFYGELNPSFAAPAGQCLGGNSFDFEALGLVNDLIEIDWDFGIAADPGASNEIEVEGVSFNSAGWQVVTLEFSLNECLGTFTDSVQVFEEPIVDLVFPDTAACPPIAFQFPAAIDTEIPLTYDWDFGDGESSDEATPFHVYNSPGFYDVSLSIMGPGNCQINYSETFNNAVQVYPVPVAFFSVDPVRVNLSDAEVTITDLSEGSISCEYFTTDGGYLDDCNGSYTFTEGGNQLITQWVENIYGCRDSINHFVAVEGYLFYAPNAFTPNEDGVNDVWIPQVAGAMDYELQIFNRWGEMIFETEDPNEPWIGNHRNGDYFVPNGVYVWRCKLTDFVAVTHEFSGHITLIR